MYTYEYIKDLMFNLKKYRTQVEFAYEFSDDDIVVQKEKEVVLMDLFLQNLNFDDKQIMFSKLEYCDSYEQIAGRFGELSRVAIYKKVKKVIEKAVDLFNSTLICNDDGIDLDKYMSKMEEVRIDYLIKNYNKISLMCSKACAIGKVSDNIKELIDDIKKLRLVVDSLDSEDMKIIKSCYFSKKSLTRLAQEMHMSVSTIRRHRDNAVQEIKKRMYAKVEKMS